MEIINEKQEPKKVFLTKNGLKEAFWKRGGVFEEFCDISYQKIVSIYYVGSKIDNFLDNIVNEHEKELLAKNEEIDQLKRKLVQYQSTEVKFK